MTTWTTRDELAGVAGLAVATGYVLPPVKGAVVGALTPVLAPVATLMPFSLFVLLLAGTSATTTSVVQLRVRNRARVEELQSRLEDLRERFEPGGDDLDAEVQAELASTWAALLKQNLRPIGWTLLVTAPAFIWLRWAVASPAVAAASTTAFVPVLGPMAWTATLVGPLKLWLAWYLGASLSTGYVSRRLAARAAN